MPAETMFETSMFGGSFGPLVIDIFGRETDFPFPSPFDPSPGPTIPSDGEDDALARLRSVQTREVDRRHSEGLLSTTERDRVLRMLEVLPYPDGRDNSGVDKARAVFADLRREAEGDQSGTVNGLALLSLGESLYDALVPSVEKHTKEDKAALHEFAVDVLTAQGALAGFIAGMPLGPGGMILGAHAGAHIAHDVGEALWQLGHGL